MTTPVTGPATGEWARAFDGVERVVALSSGFTLVPVEMPGPDVATELAKYLESEGHRVAVVHPQSSEAWTALAAALFSVHGGPGAVVILVGTREVTPPVLAGLRLVNQRRDSLAAHLACPLLWCGPHTFLDATWDAAPDLWSVRARTHSLEASMTLPPEAPLGPVHPVSDGTERLREIWDAALARGDGRAVTQVALHLASALVEESAYEEAESVVARALEGAGPAAADEEHARAQLWLLRAHLAVVRGATADAEAHGRAADALGAGGTPERALTTGNLLLTTDAAAAYATYALAEEASLAEGDPRGAAVAQWSQGNARIALGDLEGATESFEGALGMARALGDARLEARALSALGRVHAALHDARRANAMFDDALAVTREIGDRHGEARVLRRLARIYVALGDAEKAVEDCERALAIARSLGDARGEGKGLTVLARALGELGEQRRADEALDAAQRIATALNDERMLTSIRRTRASLQAPSM